MKYFIFLCLLVISCTFSKNKSEEKKNVNNFSIDYFSHKKEILKRNDIRLNNKYNLILNKKDLVGLLGKPDKVYQSDLTSLGGNYTLLKFKGININNYNKVNFLFYGESVFQEIGNLSIVQAIDFQDSNIKLIHPKIIFSKETSIYEIKSIFPESYKLKKIGSNVLEGRIFINGSPSIFHYEGWILYFRKGKLRKMIYIYQPLRELEVKE